MYCVNCGNKLEKSYKFCPKCGNKIVETKEEEKEVKTRGRKKKDVVEEENKSAEDKIKATIEEVMDTPDETNTFDRKEIKDNTFLAILSYLGFLALVPYFYNNKSEYVKYHATQGMNLFIVWVLYYIVENLLRFITVGRLVYIQTSTGILPATKEVTPFWISLPMGIIGVTLAIITVIGIVYACEGKAKELPLINKIKIIK